MQSSRGGGKNPPKYLNFILKGEAFFHITGTQEIWKDGGERVEDGPAFSSNPMNLKACYCSQAMADCHLSGCEQPLFQMLS
jgi:hypothetical protein